MNPPQQNSVEATNTLFHTICQYLYDATQDDQEQHLNIQKLLNVNFNYRINNFLSKITSYAAAKHMM